LLSRALTTVETAKTIRCHSGCAHCCHLPVAIVAPEAHILAQALQQRHLSIDHDRLTMQAQWTTDQEWHRHAVNERRCIFLDTHNRCSVYDVRPMSCRKYFSISPPELCDTDRYPGQEIQIWFDLSSEVFTSAAMTQYETGYLPQLVLNVLYQPTTNEDLSHDANTRMH
jgi:Fe-S-cluster containining protein